MTKDSIHTGKWTITEQKAFLQGISLYGKDWRKISQLVKTRSGSQIRSHAQKHFAKLQQAANQTSDVKQVSVTQKKQKNQQDKIQFPHENYLYSYCEAYLKQYLNYMQIYMMQNSNGTKLQKLLEYQAFMSQQNNYKGLIKNRENKIKQGFQLYRQQSKTSCQTIQSDTRFQK